MWFFIELPMLAVMGVHEREDGVEESSAADEISDLVQSAPK
jgi:hypothetical protein